MSLRHNQHLIITLLALFPKQTVFLNSWFDTILAMPTTASITEADIQGWLSMLEAQSPGNKTEPKAATPLYRHPDRR